MVKKTFLCGILNICGNKIYDRNISKDRMELCGHRVTMLHIN